MTTNIVHSAYSKKSKKQKRQTRKFNKRGRPMNNIFYRRLMNKISSLPRGNIEVKYVNTSGTATPSTTPINILLNPLSQGTGMLNRIGNSVRFTKIELNVKYTISGVANNTSIRVLLILDKQPNGVVLDNPYSSATLVSQFDPAFMYRYIIIKQWVKSYSISGIQESYDSTSINLDFHTRFQNNLGTIADLASNSFWVLFTSDETINTPSVQYDARMSFVDD